MTVRKRSLTPLLISLAMLVSPAMLAAPPECRGGGAPCPASQRMASCHGTSCCCSPEAPGQTGVATCECTRPIAALSDPVNARANSDEPTAAVVSAGSTTVAGSDVAAPGALIDRTFLLLDDFHNTSESPRAPPAC